MPGLDTASRVYRTCGASYAELGQARVLCIHRKKHFIEEDGLPGHKRVYARLQRAMPGNDDGERSVLTAAFGRLFSWRKRMAPTPEQTELGYHRMWDRAQIAAAKLDGARKTARAIIANRASYAAVEEATGVPWFMIGPIHARESDMDFKTHLHNGDSLKARTHHVPASRPKRGNPPFQWDESAIDALTMAPHELQKVKAWSVERILYETEKYNGWGYLKRGNSPYLWSWTSEYHGG